MGLDREVSRRDKGSIIYMHQTNMLYTLNLQCYMSSIFQLKSKTKIRKVELGPGWV